MSDIKIIDIKIEKCIEVENALLKLSSEQRERLGRTILFPEFEMDRLLLIRFSSPFSDGLDRCISCGISFCLICSGCFSF